MQIFLSLPSLVQTCLEMNKECVKILAEKIYTQKSLFIIARGSSLPFAKEMALKLKELCYIHAEAISAGELKHGPLAMIDSSYESKKT